MMVSLSTYARPYVRCTNSKQTNDRLCRWARWVTLNSLDLYNVYKNILSFCNRSYRYRRNFTAMHTWLIFYEGFLNGYRISLAAALFSKVVKVSIKSYAKIIQVLACKERDSLLEKNARGLLLYIVVFTELNPLACIKWDNLLEV